MEQNHHTTTSNNSGGSGVGEDQILTLNIKKKYPPHLQLSNNNFTGNGSSTNSLNNSSGASRGVNEQVEIGWVDTPMDEKELVGNYNPYAIPFSSPITARSRPTLIYPNQTNGRINHQQQQMHSEEIIIEEHPSSIGTSSVYESSHIQIPMIGVKKLNKIRQDSSKDLSEHMPHINNLSVKLLTHIFSFLCDQLNEKEEQEDSESDDEEFDEDPEVALNTARNKLRNAPHSLEDLVMEGSKSGSLTTPTIPKRKNSSENRNSKKYYSEFEIEEDDGLTSDWLSAGLGHKKFVDTDRIVGSATERIKNLKRSISVPSISLLLSKNFSDSGQSKDDSSILLEDSTANTVKQGAKKVLNYSKEQKKKEKQKIKEQIKLKNRCERFMVNHAKRRHIWIHQGNANISLVCKKWHIASCNNDMWSLATIMLFLHLSRFSVSFRAFDKNDLNKLISSYYTSPQRREEIRKKLQVLCDYLLPDKDTFMDAVVQANNKQFSLEHLNQFSSKLTSAISKRAGAVRNTVKATMNSIDRKITATTDTLTEKLEHHISQNKISNTLLGHDIKESTDSPPDDFNIAEEGENQLLEAPQNTVTPPGEAVPTTPLAENQDVEDEFEVIPSPHTINQDIIDSAKKRRKKQKRMSTKVDIRNIFDDDGLEEEEDPSNLLSSNRITNTRKKKRNGKSLQDPELKDLNIHSKKYRFFKDTFIEMKKIQQFEYERLVNLKIVENDKPEKKENIKFLLRNTFPEMLSTIVATTFLFMYIFTTIPVIASSSTMYYTPSLIFWVWSLVIYLPTWTAVWITSFVLYRRINKLLSSSHSNPDNMTSPRNTDTEALLPSRQNEDEFQLCLAWIKSWINPPSPAREFYEENSIGLTGADKTLFYMKRLQMKLTSHSFFYHLIGIMFIVPVMILTLLDFLMIQFEVSGWFGVFAIPCFIYFVAAIISGLLFVIAIWDSIVYLFRKYISYDLTEAMKRQLRVISIRNFPFLLAYGAAMSFLLVWFLVAFSAFLDHQDTANEENVGKENNHPDTRFSFEGIGYTFGPLYIGEVLTLFLYLFALIMRSSYYKNWLMRTSILCVACAASQIFITLLATTSLEVMCYLTIIIPVVGIFLMVVIPQLRYIHQVGSRFYYMLK
ncbi:hypothetical protein NAEGRDRAFT_78544 [Naegleria gruberi]|uniref:Uncharacterized protein n=1 Tax=Naegleria gruberi TaxID=5762 RepID=D2V4I1_NAEGR|nr:uncharacterized protein NAEGRDRAFT_78544 [Naegleria gruberi]EFC48521.1 hypothetical protein NAEGRDRAFT_78544 [Naegleria gruberi]|eukprot:XP_002681265.1 hypothetical protein NAEGRDRAFT_78544 [Naegleria gruberi strain NEG-M]